jgi:hypothetical protein
LTLTTIAPIVIVELALNVFQCFHWCSLESLIVFD